MRERVTADESQFALVFWWEVDELGANDPSGGMREAKASPTASCKGWQVAVDSHLEAANTVDVTFPLSRVCSPFSK
jgi:hypothetical protein